MKLIHAIACIAALGVAVMAAPALANDTSADYPVFERLAFDPAFDLVVADPAAVAEAVDLSVHFEVGLSALDLAEALYVVEPRPAPPAFDAASPAVLLDLATGLRLGGGAAAGVIAG